MLKNRLHTGIQQVLGLWPVLVFVLVTIYMLYPMSLHFGTLVRGRPFEDAFEYIWYLDWYKQALFDLRISPLFQPDIFFPGGWNLGFAAFPPLHPILLSPLTSLIGSVTAYNLVIMATCIFAAYGVFLVGRALGTSELAAVLAGVAYAFYPERQVGLAGHLNLLLGSLWVPWVFYCLIRADRKPASRTRWMIAAALAFSLSMNGAWNFIFMTTVVVAIFGIVYLLPQIWVEPRTWIWPLAAGFLTILIVACPWLWLAAQSREAIGAEAEFSFQNISSTSVPIDRFFIPNRMNPLLWGYFEGLFPTFAGAGTSIVTFSYIVWILAIVGLVGWRPWSREVRGLVGVVAIGFFLMLGPILHFMGRPVVLAWPRVAMIVGSVLPELVTSEGILQVPMPAYLLYKLVPPFRSFHGFDRWGMVTALGMALFAAMGLTYLSRNLKTRAQFALGGLCFLLMMVELSPLPQVHTSISEMERDVDTWLANQPGRNVIIEYPLSYSMKGQSLYYTSAHGQKIVHGYSSILPVGFPEKLPVLDSWPEDEAIDLLQEIGARYVLVDVYQGDQDFEDDTLPELLSINRIRLIQRFDDVVGPVRTIYLFELVDVESRNQAQ